MLSTYNKKDMKRLDTVMSRADEDENDSSDSNEEKEKKSPKKPIISKFNQSPLKPSTLTAIATNKSSPKKIRSSAIDFRPKRISVVSDFSSENEGVSEGGTSRNKSKRQSMKLGRKASMRSSIFSQMNSNSAKAHQYTKIQEIIQDEETLYPEHDLDEDEKKKEDQRLEREFEEMKSTTIESTELLYVQFKNPFERVKAYSDSYPLLFLRKYIYFVIKFTSWISFKIIKNPIFETISLLVILWNSIMMATQNDDYELVFTYLYTVEMTLKILGMGFVLNKGAYLREAWNILDFLIVVSSLIPLVLKSSSVNISVLRSFRVLRPLKTISSIKNLKVLLNTLFSALPMLLETLMILFFFFMIFAIGGLQLYMGLLKRRCFDVATGIVQLSDNKEIICGYADCPVSPGKTFVCGKMISNPNWGITNFDNIFYSLLNVFQCVTLEGWYEIFIYVARAFHIATVLYFVVLVFIGAFFLLNLTLAVIKLKFTQSQNTKDVKVVEAIDKVDEIELNELRTFKKGERSFYKKKFQHLLNKFDSYGANPEFNAINNSPMLEFFENILVISRRKSRRSTLVKNLLGKNPYKDKEKKLKIPKMRSNKNSEKKSFNIRGIKFKGFTDLPVIDEKIEIESPVHRSSRSIRSSKRFSGDIPVNDEEKILDEIDILMEGENTRSKSLLMRENGKKDSIVSLKSKSLPKNPPKKEKVSKDETLALLDELEDYRRRESNAGKLIKLPSQILGRRLSKMDTFSDPKNDSSKPKDRRFSVMDSFKFQSTPKSDPKTFRKKVSMDIGFKNFSDAMETLKESDKDKDTKGETKDGQSEKIIEKENESNTPLDSERNKFIEDSNEETLRDIPLNARFGDRRVSKIKKVFDTIFGKQQEPSGPLQGVELARPTPKNKRNSISMVFKKAMISEIPEEMEKSTKLQLVTKKMMMMHQETKRELDQIPSPSANTRSLVHADFYNRSIHKNKLSIKEFTKRIAQVYSIKDFKFGVFHKLEFEPSSYNDVLDLLLKRRLQMEQDAIAERIRSMRYSFNYIFLQDEEEEEEDDLITYRKKKKIKKNKSVAGRSNVRSMTSRSMKRQTTSKSTSSMKSNSNSEDKKEFKLPLQMSDPYRIQLLKSSKSGRKKGSVIPEEELSSIFSPTETQTQKNKKKKIKIKIEEFPIDDYEKVKSKINEELFAITETDDDGVERETDKIDNEDEIDDLKKTDNMTIYRLVRVKVNFIKGKRSQSRNNFIP